MIAAAPALPLRTAGPYVAAAYIVFVVVIALYVAIMATRLRRAERELAALRAVLEDREGAGSDERTHDPETVAAGRLMQPPVVAAPEGERGPV